MDIKGLPFAKGHGTGNDFVIVPDPDGEVRLSAERVAALCDRRRGLGGDGLLRVVRTAAEPEVAAHAAEAEWFMDYRNADGSLAEMCGNGVRVFARYLVEAGLVTGNSVAILTRAGRVVADIGTDVIAVDMPLPTVFAGSVVRLSGVDFPGTVASCGNPNLVCQVDDPDLLDLTGTPVLDPITFPAGANVEFITTIGRSHVRMRVIERGVGETLSCGSGACAVAAVVLRHTAGEPGGDLVGDLVGRSGGEKVGRAGGESVSESAGQSGGDLIGQSDGESGGVAPVTGTVTVDVPGGRLTVRLDGERCVLSGPAVIVAAGTVR